MGQDYPLYDNKEIVAALKGLHGNNVIQSFQMPEDQKKHRHKYSYEFFKRFNGFEHSAYSSHCKGPKLTLPPNNISIFKGSTFVSLTRGFCKYVQNDLLPNRLLSLGTVKPVLRGHPRVPVPKLKKGLGPSVHV